MSVAQIFDELNRKRAKKNIIILDACRSNPVAEKYSLEAGLAQPATHRKNVVGNLLRIDHASSACSAANAISAAFCWASFFDFPRARPYSLSPSKIATSKVLSWSGPCSAMTV